MDDNKINTTWQEARMSSSPKKAQCRRLFGTRLVLWRPTANKLRPTAKFAKMVAGKVKKPGKRGRKPAKIDLKAKLERSRQSARECRARKKLRYQYLEELVSSKERAICALREELEMYKQWCSAMDQGKIPSEIKALLTGDDQKIPQGGSGTKTKNSKNNISSNGQG
ncbi:cAMP-responsive element-binding protein-like 2 isoform X1 [Dicentrarchus labrax]|uniref:cAMP-responsive element-binding protein-like 2 n=1 Tax=Dicentrarchus labrax TaxID=13489 RepID=A0A8P4KDU0_DICLA|nr:cAMP-responsive element-binding protein-like 2 isoform X1 [Dicentrarchus labrax]